MRAHRPFTTSLSVEERIARHRAFWRMEMMERPLLGAYAGGYTYPIIYDVADEGDFLTPAHFRPANRLLEQAVEFVLAGQAPVIKDSSG